LRVDVAEGDKQSFGSTEPSEHSGSSTGASGQENGDISEGKSRSQGGSLVIR